MLVVLLSWGRYGQPNHNIPTLSSEVQSCHHPDRSDTDVESHGRIAGQEEELPGGGGLETGLSVWEQIGPPASSWLLGWSHLIQSPGPPGYQTCKLYSQIISGTLAVYQRTNHSCLKDLDNNNVIVMKSAKSPQHSPDTLVQFWQKTFKLFIRRHISISFLLPLLSIGIPVFSMSSQEPARILSCKDINPVEGRQAGSVDNSVLCINIHGYQPQRFIIISTTLLVITYSISLLCASNYR